MGDLQRQLFQNKLRQAEATLGLNFTEDNDSSDGVTIDQGNANSNKKDQTEYPKWDTYFKENKTIVRNNEDSFNTYYIPPKTETSPVFIFHHGAGSSGMTFGPLSKEIISQMSDPKDPESNKVVAGIFTFDSRGSGETHVTNNQDDYSLEQLTEDAIFLIEDLIERENLQRNSLFLIGHSLGGSILTNVAYRLKSNNVKGLGMFDIVEETAVRALSSMDTYLANLPKSFKTLKRAIDWYISSNLLRNVDSALASVPSYFRYDPTSDSFKWIMDLKKTKPYWNTWFTDLSKRFVNAPSSKLLILAGTDNLDKELMIGQMQGKYQLVVFQDSGHFIQEDVPYKTAITLIDFWKRNDRNQVVIKSTWGVKK